MKKLHLTAEQREKVIAVSIVMLGFTVLLGQVIETRSILFRDVLAVFRMYIDPIQYMIGMLVINFILVLAAIKKYKQYPNPFLDTIKWYFAILLVNDFVVLVLRVLQNSNLLALKASLNVGMGKTYMILATVRGLTDLTFTSIATLLLVYGLIRYLPYGQVAGGALPRLGRIMLGLVVGQWLFSIPVNLTFFISSRFIYGLALGLSQAGQITVVALLYWTVKENHLKYHTRFFRYLTNYYTLALAATGLVFTYSMGSFDVLQRFPAGETGVIGGFGELVFYISRLAYVIQNYLMFWAITDYAELPRDENNPGD